MIAADRGPVFPRPLDARARESSSSPEVIPVFDRRLVLVLRLYRASELIIYKHRRIFFIPLRSWF